MQLRNIALIALVSCLLPATALAAKVFGDIRLDGKPLAAGVPVKISRPLPSGEKSSAASAMADSTATDKFGAYKLTVKEEGKCSLTILYEKQTVSLDVFSYKEATRYDLILEKKDGKLSLRRK